jgi:hypothetical protein
MELEMAIWNIWSMNRITGAITTLAIIIAIWIAARFASVASEQSEENKNIGGKIILTLFGASVIGGGIMSNLMSQRNWTVTADAFNNMKNAGMDLSPAATEFMTTYSGEPSLLNTPLALVFFVTAFLIILFPIWFKK